MPLTDLEIRNLKGGDWPVKRSSSDQGKGLPKINKPKNRTKGILRLVVRGDRPSSEAWCRRRNGKTKLLKS